MASLLEKMVDRIVIAYIQNYVEPINKQMYPDKQQPYYPEQEMTYNDLSQLDSPHGECTFQERYKQVFPGEDVQTDRAEGGYVTGDSGYTNFLAPKELNFFHNEKDSPNDNSTLTAGIIKSASINDFLYASNFIKKASSMDLSEFMKIGEDVLVHKSKRDLWKMVESDNGEVFIKRLFDDQIIKE